MFTFFSDPVTRRHFFNKSGRWVLGGAMAPLASTLSSLGQAHAFTGTDYRALVCVFLAGGNDHNNTVVPYDEANHARYSSARGGASALPGMVLARSELMGTVLRPTQALASGRQFALNPAMPELASLFNAGQAAILLNVGPLVMPLTRQQYMSSDLARYPRPPKLFSHNDQTSIWQSSSPEGSTVGWGGAFGDTALPSNAFPLYSCISVAGNSVYLTGTKALQYQCGTQGAIAVRALQNSFLSSAGMRDAFLQLIQSRSAHELEDEYAVVRRRALEAESQVSKALSAVNLRTEFPSGNNLADQLRSVARLIAARDALGARRQVFMVTMGGFDLHDNLTSRHSGLLRKVSQAISAFYSATMELGVADKVTTFTASDFGRTLTSNGDGTDHGWGSHHFLVGGAVRGSAFYGTPPPMSVSDTDSPDDQWHVGQGRLLPSTSVDQYAATLGRWFGLSPSELLAVLPSLKNFGVEAGRPDYPRDLGFV